MKYCSLMSGSWGNCHYIKSESTEILIDVGQSGKRVLNNMLHAGCGDGKNISGILVTHAHRDHVIGVGILARKLKIPIFATEGTWYEMDRLVGPVPAELRHYIGTEDHWQIGDLKLESFPTSHDALESVGFVIRDRDTSLGVATDCGVFSSRMERCLHNLHGLILEANHDLKMLRNGPYPQYLKQRIAGTEGHLSNEDAALGLKKVIGPLTKHVILAHLSEENNKPGIALQSMYDILGESTIDIKVSPRCIPGNWMEL